MELIEINKEWYVDARELHKELGIKKTFTTWFRNNKERAMLLKSDFMPSRVKSNGGRPKHNFFLTRDAAIALILISGGKFARQVRDSLINLYKKHESGLAFTSEQIYTLIELSKAMTLISIQQDVEKQHYALYNNPYKWWKYRADLLGYSKTTLIEAMKKVNLKHKSIRKSLIKLDANELIRTGIVDLFKILGKTDEYAKNVGNLCKKFAKEIKLENIIWDDTKDDPLGINKKSVDERKELFNNNQLKLK